MRCCILLASLAALLLPAAAVRADDDGPILQIESGGHTAACKWLAFTADGKSLLSAGDDKVVREWNLADPAKPALARSFRLQLGAGPEGRIYAGAIRPGGRILALGGFFDRDGGQRFGDIRLVDTADGHVLGILKGHANVVDALAFSPDGRWLASAGEDRTVRIWDVVKAVDQGQWAGAEQECSVLMGHTAGIYGLAFAAADRLVSGSYDHTLRLWHSGGDGRWTFAATMTGHDKEVRAVACSPDGAYAASASFDHTVRLWDARTGEAIGILGQLENGVSSVAFTPDGKNVVSGDKDYACRVWRVPGGGESARFAGHDNAILSTAVSPDGKLVASGGGDNNDIWLWDPATGRPVSRISGTGRRVRAVAFSADGQQIAFGNTWGSPAPLEQTFDLFQVSLGGAVADASTWQRGPLQAGTLSAAQGHVNQLVIRRGASDSCTVTRRNEYDRVRCYAFAPGGRVVVGSDFALTLNDTFTGGEVREFIGHTGAIYSAAVSPDGRLLVSASADQTMRLWNIETGELLLTVFVASDREWVAWTPAGYYKASAKGDRLIGWHVNRGADKAADFYFAWQFRRRFDRADVVERVAESMSVAKAVEAAESNPRHKRQEPADIRQIIRLVPPTVTIEEPANGAMTADDTIRLRATITPNATSDEPITDVRVLVNGRPAVDPRQVGIAAPVGGTPVRGVRKIDLSVPLVAGDNEIAIVSMSASATSQPVSVKIVHKATATTTTFQPDLYVLAIGISKYQDDKLNLRWADADATQLADVLKAQAGRSLYRNVETKVLINTAATRGGIIAGLKWLRTQATQRDLAVVLICGHGVRDESGAYYFVTHDADTKDPESTCLPCSQFREMLDRVPCKVLLAMDTCHSGAVGRKSHERQRGVGRDGLEVSDVVKDFTSVESGVVVMCSSTGKESSMEDDEWGHGAFTLAMLEGFTGRRYYAKAAQTPLPLEHVVGVIDLDYYVTHRVRELTDGRQHPMTDRGALQSFPLAVLGVQ